LRFQENNYIDQDMTGRPMHEFLFRNTTLMCESVPLHDVVAQCGTPLYLYSKHSVLDQCRHIEQAFEGYPHLACYAVKANANRELLRLIAADGFGADVGSRGELHLALAAGFPAEKITFSGVGKRDDEIAYALENNILAFNVESEEEIDVLNQIGGEAGKSARILLRVNLDIDAGGHAYVSTSLKQNKFGVPRWRAHDILCRAAGLKHIEVRGVHSHIGSQITRTETFLEAARSIGTLVAELRSAGLEIRDVDFGGGFGVQYHGFLVHPQLPREEPERPDLSTASMIRAILPVLKETGCHLLIQPGRSIVAYAGVLLVKVVYRKTAGEKIFIVVDGGMNDLIRPSLYHSYHQVVPLALTGALHETVDVVGPVCESGDFFALDRRLPRVQRGEFLALMCAGAYGYVLSSNYNARPRPAEVLVDGSSWKVIRERETIEKL
jgi:diaminopimelate decarboxylase